MSASDEDTSSGLDQFELKAVEKLKYICELQFCSQLYCVNLITTFSKQLHRQSLGEPMIEQKMYQVAVSLIQSFDELEKRSNG